MSDQTLSLIREHIALTKNLALEVQKLAESQRQLAGAIQVLMDMEKERNHV
jgi:hypothetical protein